MIKWCNRLYKKCAKCVFCTQLAHFVIHDLPRWTALAYLHGHMNELSCYIVFYSAQDDSRNRCRNVRAQILLPWFVGIS